MKKFQPLIIAFIAFTATGISAQTALMDFQDDVGNYEDANTNPGLGDAYHILTEDAGPSATVSIANLNDTDGTATGWGFSLTHDGISSYTYLQSNSSGTFSDSAAGDGWRSNAGTNSSWLYSFSGLDNASSYDISFYSKSGLSFTSDVDYTLTTGTATTTSLTGIDTTVGSLVTFTGITPSAGTIVFNSFANGSGNPATRGNSLAAASITVVPEPGTLMLLGSALTGLLASRRFRRK